jgi:hypothetical protein
VEPLIELPEPARARIRDGETKAQEGFQRTQVACEQDALEAHRRWGGYLDLNQDNLRYEIQQAQACLQQGIELFAQFIFLVHAVEYRQELRDPGKIKPVLSRLCDAIVGHFGTRVKNLIEATEVDQLRRAVVEWNANPGIEYLPPALVGDAAFWRERRADFGGYNTDNYNALIAQWDSVKDSWSVRGPAEAQAIFEPLAAIAAKGIKDVDQARRSRTWLDELRRRGRHYFESPPSAVGEVGTHGVLSRPFDVSVKLCLEFEAIAPALAETPAPRIPPQESARKPPRQNRRYQKIDEGLRLIAESHPSTQEEVFGLLDNRGIPHPPSDPFASAGGWTKGFHNDEAAARSWLSKRWAKLQLPPLRRGPKKK